MEVKSGNSFSANCHNGLKIKRKKQVSFSGKGEAAKFVVKEGYKDIINPAQSALSLITALTSTVGFGIGGAGLMWDHFSNKKSGETPNSNTNSKSIKSSISAFNKKHSATLQNKFNVAFGNEKEKNQKGEEKLHTEGDFGHIQPKTPFGKLGLKFAKVGIGFSGIAGFFNGISMKLPLMAAGESLNFAASPIINTPTGFGLFSIALSAIFAGRALENDPELKLNTATLASKKGLPAKAKYIGQNMVGCVKAMFKSTGEVAKNTVDLVRPGDKHKNAVKFFKECIFGVRSTTVTVAEKMFADGRKDKLEKVLKSHPHRMHTASIILGLGGLGLVATSALKKIGILPGKKGTDAQKAAFKTTEAGMILDNAGLAYQGLEKFYMGKPLSGVPLAISGATMISGAPNAEKDYGRALQWLGCSALFASFVAERAVDFNNARKGRLKPGQLAKEGSEAIRIWEYAFPREIMAKRGHLNNLREYLGSDGISIKGFANKLGDLFKNKKQKEIEKEAKRVIAREAMLNDPKVRPYVLEFENNLKKLNQGDMYEPKIATKDLNGLKLISQGDEGEVAKNLFNVHIKKFDKNYNPELERIKNNPQTPEKIKVEAKKSLEEMIGKKT